MVWIRLDGAPVPVETSVVDLNYGGRNAHLVFVHNISNRKKMEEEKEKLQSALYHSQKLESVGRLAGGVAHDFNNMLTLILCNAEMALEQQAPGHPARENLVDIRKAALRSSDLTRQLLAFARKQLANPKVLNLNETLEGMLQLLRRLIGENIRLVWNPAENLWPVRVDPTQIDQILANLCINARDAIGETGTIHIETRAVRLDEAYCSLRPDLVPGDYALLSVTDDGCGMDAESLKKVFEPFYTTKAVGKGTGLGLATVYGIVKQNQGLITVYSEPGKGTNFKIYLPRHDEKAGVGQSEEAPAPPVRGHETILLVEDEPGILKIAKRMLEGLGYRVLAAPTPGEALRLAAENPGEIQLLVTDVVMSEMNGRELAQKLSAVLPDLKRLFMSGYSAHIIAQQDLMEDRDRFLQKPFSVQELASAVRATLESGISEKKR
jgi:signal transduction histidine kinase/CheY-like chemotaxis protein